MMDQKQIIHEHITLNI